MEAEIVTDELFREDSQLRDCTATILAVTAVGDIVLDRTVCYPQGGGQPGDSGALLTADGLRLAITNTVYAEDKIGIHHRVAAGQAPPVGSAVTVVLDWDRRLRLMRCHTGLHLLCSLVRFPVTGGQIGENEGRLDFDIPDVVIDKEELTQQLNALIAGDHPVTHRWITDDEMAARPELIRTMSVKPPMGRGRVRLVQIGEIDLQPCGGTHVGSTAEIGRATITKIEKKGAVNRRIRVTFT
jgi:misacylated tRNA(Ala) deacylase